jgi:putative ABC transport system substrate-binding protein
MRRRTFIEGIAVLAAAWPLAAHAQQVERMRLIGMLMLWKADSREGQDCVRAFQQALQNLGWNDGRNVRTEIRWGENNVDLLRQYATELVALRPDVILAAGSLSAISLQHIRSAFLHELRI